VLAFVLDGLATIAAARAEWQRLVQLLGALTVYHEQSGTPFTTHARGKRDGLLGDTRAALGEESYAVGWRAGREKATETAIGAVIELALGDDDTAAGSQA
jgi:hypothetical protein